MMDLAHPELIIFDWDGTLVDTFELLYGAHNHVREAMGLAPWSPDEARHYIRASAREIYPEIYGEHYREALGLLYDYVEKNHLEMLASMPSAGEVLDHLHHETDIALAVISNKKQYYLEREVAYLGWLDYFGAIVGAGAAAYDKPSPAPVYYLFDRLKDIGVSIPDTNRVWLIGDTETDMICADKAHITPIFVRNGFGKDNVIQKHTPQGVINDCKNLIDVLQKRH